MMRRAGAIAALLIAPLAAWAQAPGTAFRDCADCPRMVVVPAGTFMMGAEDGDGESIANERPRHEVRVPAFALGRTHVTRGEFARFIAVSGYRPEPGCWHPPTPPLNIEGHGPWEQDPRRTWRRPGFAQGDDHPVVCVSHDDAEAYAAWLSARARQPYRLPSDAEWEYAARAGITAQRRPRDASCRQDNLADLSYARTYRLRPHPDHVAMCDDGHPFTAPAGRFRANAFGLRDMMGNAAQWIADCFHETYAGAPTDGTAWIEGGTRWPTGECRHRVLRGGSWLAAPGPPRFASRGPREADYRSVIVGFRVARALAP